MSPASLGSLLTNPLLGAILATGLVCTGCQDDGEDTSDGPSLTGSGDDGSHQDDGGHEGDTGMADDGGPGDDGPGDDGPGDDGPGDDGPGDDGPGDDGPGDDGPGDDGTGDDGPGDDGPGDDGTGDDGPGDDGAGSDSGDPPPPTDDVPDSAYCEEVADWDPAWSQHELDILDIVNEYRAQGADCGSEGVFGAAPPLAMNPELRCAARKHSKDMVDRNFFDHDNPSGESPFDRMDLAGYGGGARGENIAGGSSDAEGTMEQWMTSDGHCSNIMSPSYDYLGVGYYPGGQYGHMWTQTFGG